MDEPEIHQFDTASDNSSGPDELDALLAQFDAETARPAAGNGHDEMRRMRRTMVSTSTAMLPTNGLPPHG